MASQVAVSQEPDRDTRHAYLEWLTMEARLLQEELFPAADNSRQSTPCNTFAKSFHFPAGRSWREVPPPSSALLYALVYETTLRLWDVAGQWWPIEKGGVSDIIDAQAGLKWFGLRWENIDDNLLLKFTPSKTEHTSGKSIAYPLSKAPMVLEELVHWPVGERIGPIIVSETTGLPYNPRAITDRWAEDRKAAHIDSKAWARDLRASGITEGRASGATTDDAAKVAGHSGTRTTSAVYDRATEAAADRFADARLKGREQSGNGSGNGR